MVDLASGFGPPPAPPAPPCPIVHPDDAAVDRFAYAMKAKMAKQRAKGYYGWDRPSVCSAERLKQMLADHIQKGDPVDVGNFAMMLFNRGESTQPAPMVSGEILRDAFAQALVSVYVCGRVWEAWQVGTMTEDDFQPASECDEVLDSLVEAARQFNPWIPASTPPTESDGEVLVLYTKGDYGLWKLGGRPFRTLNWFSFYVKAWMRIPEGGAA